MHVLGLVLVLEPKTLVFVLIAAVLHWGLAMGWGYGHEHGHGHGWVHGFEWVIA